MRRKTKWVFAVLAGVFAFTFVFLGVGSGGSALSDILNGNIHLFGSGGGASIQSLEKNVAKHPTDPKARLKLADALKTKSDKDASQTVPAIAAYRAYLKLKPGDTDALTTLGQLYATRVSEMKSEIQNPPTPPLSIVNTFLPVSQNTTLGTALSSLLPTALGVTSLQAGDIAQRTVDLGQVIDRHLGVYRKLAARNPSDSSAFLEIANAATQDGDLPGAVAVYRQFLKKYQNDPLVPDIKRQIKTTLTQIAQQAASAQGSTGTTGSTG
jgi:cytochrome c-type biogenesis protein CcmH/NrfG